MKKDIYIIRNIVNNKVYIGQTKDPITRWYHHKDEALNHRDNMPIHEAMRQYGFDKFYYQILEPQVDNPDEAEKFWIDFFNARENGYNVCVGGTGFGSGVDSPIATLNQKQLDSLVDDLMYSGMSTTALAEKYQCSNWTVQAVNNGQAYYNPRLKYPLRKSNRYDKEKIKQIKYALKYELDKSLSDIANEFGVDASQVSEINQGRIHAYSNEEYPLRSGKNKNTTPDYIVQGIINDLINSPDMQQKDIARKYNVSCNCVTGINLGRNFFNPNLTYPLRDHGYIKSQSKKTLTLSEVNQIEDLLANSSTPLREIAAMFECGLPTIQNINNGAIAKYHNPDKRYPIRDNRYHR